MNRSWIPGAPAVLGICILILAAWLISAWHHNLALIESQHSRLLLGFGALNGASLQAGEYWKLFTSQFLHVRFPHMLFNAGMILVVGGALERRHGTFFLLLAFLVCGLTGQYASVASYPGLVTSGASQALCGLVGMMLVGCFWTRYRIKGGLLYACIGFVLVQVFLDVYFSGKIKAGHSAGFLAGAVFGVIYRLSIGILKKSPNRPEPGIQLIRSRDKTSPRSRQ